MRDRTCIGWITGSLIATALMGCAAGGPPPLDLSESRIAVPPVPQWAQLRSLVDQRSYDELHEILERYRVAALQDVERGEEPLILAYQAFEVADDKLLEKLDRWVSKRPKSWHARTARAFCRLELAYQARGTGWGKDLTSAQIDGTRKHHAAATIDALTALKLQPKSVAAHHILLAIARHNTTVNFEPATRAALKAFPASYILRFDTAWSLQPRWKGGEGNYEPIEKFVKESQDHAAENPRLRRLLAMPYWARGRDEFTAKRVSEAVGLFNAAIAIAEDRLFLEARALALAGKRDYRAAFKDARRYRDLAPPTGDDAGPDEVARDVMRSARGWIARALVKGDVHEAVTALDAVLEHFPDDGFMNVARATVRCRSGDVPGAIKDFDRARAGKQASPHLDRLQAACVASGGKPIDAIRRAESRLLLEPGVGEAQFELGLLYALVGDMVSAVSAYRVACELGVVAACERVKGLREVAQRAPALLQAELRKSWALHEQERLRSVEEHAAFFARLERSPDFQTGGPPVIFAERELPDFPAWVSDVRKGSVTVLIYFNSDGAVAGAKVESGDPQGYFELAAIRAVLRWRIERRPTGLKARQRIEFELPPDKPVDPNQDVLIALARTPARPP